MSVHAYVAGEAMASKAAASAQAATIPDFFMFPRLSKCRPTSRRSVLSSATGADAWAKYRRSAGRSQLPLFSQVPEAGSRRHIAGESSVGDCLRSRATWTNMLAVYRLEPYQIAAGNPTFLCVYPQVELSNGYKPRVGHWPEHRIGSEAARADASRRR